VALDKEREEEKTDTNQIDTTVNVQVEDTSGEGAEVSSEKPEDEGLIEKLQRFEDKYLRAVAELENYRKRSARQVEETIRFANDRLLADLLEIVDGFDRALEHSGDNKNESGDTESFVGGVKLIHGQLMEVLRKNDVRPIEAIGNRFDPNKHEALMQIPSEEYEDGAVAGELARGYMIGDRILRHSKVSVSTGPTEKKDKQ